MVHAPRAGICKALLGTTTCHCQATNCIISMMTKNFLRGRSLRFLVRLGRRWLERERDKGKGKGTCQRASWRLWPSTCARARFGAPPVVLLRSACIGTGAAEHATARMAREKALDARSNCPPAFDVAFVRGGTLRMPVNTENSQKATANSWTRPAKQ